MTWLRLSTWLTVSHRRRVGERAHGRAGLDPRRVRGAERGGRVAALQAEQAAANSKPGSRMTPARVLPVPDDIDPATRTLVEGPYSSFWNIDPPSKDAWRENLRKAASAALPRE